MFDDRQTLIVIHREHRIVVLENVRHEYGIRRQWAAHRHAALLRPRDRRRDDADFLIAQMTTLARMRIDAADGDARHRKPPALPKILMQNLEHLIQELDGERIAHVPER